MKRISEKEGLRRAYNKLYNCNVKDIDKNLDALIKAKKFVARNDD